MAPPVQTKTQDREVVDGRVQRSVRSRQGIVEALVSLVEEGVLLPTGEQVAARAGVGQRTVFRHFQDMETLQAEIHRHIKGLVLAMIEAPSSGSLKERVDAAVRTRATIFERMAPFEAAGRLHRWHSKVVKRNHEKQVADLRAFLIDAIPELKSAPDAIVQALELLTSYEAWDRLRTDQGLGKERAQDVIRSAVMALLSGIHSTTS